MAKKKKPPNDKPKKKRGPKAQVLKIEGDWAAAVAKAMKAGKPSSRLERKRLAAKT